MSLNPFVMRDHEWKMKRAQITAGMTQNRLRAMFPLINDVAKGFTSYLKQQLAKNPGMSFDGREICAKYTCDTVASCIFAIDGCSFTKEKSEIIEMGNKMIRSISDAATSLLTKRLMPQDVEDFFIYLMDEAIKYRIANDITRDDFLHHIISLKKTKEISDLEMASIGVTLFLDGFDTTATALLPMFYELGKNKRVQDKLRLEISEAFCACEFSFEKLLDLPYLDQVMYECLRLNPPLTFGNRECSESIELEGVKGHKFLCEKGLFIFIPIILIHRDDEYYHDPEKFIPERFDNGAIKDYKDKGVLLPFSDGPRICLGMKLAIAQIKTAIAEIVSNFEISVDPKTPEILEIDPVELLMNNKKETIYLNFKSL